MENKNRTIVIRNLACALWMQAGSFAAHYEWLCEPFTPTGIDTKRLTDTQHLANGNNWYTLDGRRLSGKPTTKGVYISNNRKVVIK